MVVVGRGGLRGLRLVCKAKALRQPENGRLAFYGGRRNLPNCFGRNNAKITRNLYPHRTLLAPRVRVVLEFLLNVMKNHAGLQAERADLQLFAA